MTKLRCCFCQQELRKISATSFLVCDNCNITGFDKLWQELIRTRKALEIAVDALKNVFDYAKIVHSELQKNHLSQFQTPISKMQYSAQQALKQITALEQKD